MRLGRSEGLPGYSLVAEEVMFDGPALPPLHSGAQHQVAVLALEAVDVIVPPQSSDPGGLALTFLGEDGLFAGPTAQRELSVRLLLCQH